MKAVDQVCGMEVDTDKSEKVDYSGKSYYFCSSECKELFSDNPVKYLKMKNESHACKE